MMETAYLISNRQELIEFLNALAEKSFFDKINRPDTKWKIVNIPNITFYVNHIKDAPLGAPVDLPDYIKNNYSLRNVSADGNLCFCYCLVQTLTGVSNLPKINFVNIVSILVLCLSILQAFNVLVFCTWRIF